MQAAGLSPEMGNVVGSRRFPGTGRQQSPTRFGEWRGPHRGIRIKLGIDSFRTRHGLVLLP